MKEAFQRLHPGVQKWVYQQGWADLRDIQKEAVDLILSGESDLIISAPTAAGKTEAAFLPACSAAAGETGSFAILYISPLKALINDQYRRLEGLCAMLDMKITPWHGDSSPSRKNRAKGNPQGLLLITPESLESLLIREAGWMRAAFASLKYIIIDEYHAFIGFERGQHLQSLMRRLENLLGREKSPIPRIALSATLGDMDSVGDYLRPDKAVPCALITDSQSRNSLQIQLRGYTIRVDSPLSAHQQIAGDLYDLLRGDSHLVFANSRKRTEDLAVRLRELCRQNSVPNEFFPHHGSLAKELRVDLESRLQKEYLPTTALCTMTLELGIDIGKVKSVAQVTAPHSAASLRQRLGRSGRRGDPAVLRLFIAENEIKSNSDMGDQLRLELLQSIAMIRLLAGEKWYEPADTQQLHFSTLLHQILAVTAQWGGVRADQLWALLCESGPFNKVTVDQFKRLLSGMGARDLLTQLSGGELVLGRQGGKIVDHYHFYAVFKTPKEYRIDFEGKTLGTLPVVSFVLLEQHLVFAGRYWKIKEVDMEKRIIYVLATKGGTPPNFGGDGMSVHDRVRQEMFRVYVQGDYAIREKEARIDFLDETARGLFQEGLGSFQSLNLKEKRVISQGTTVHIIPWMGDKIVNTLTILLAKDGYEPNRFAGVIEIENAVKEEVTASLHYIRQQDLPSNAELAALVEQKETGKYDHLLPGNLLNEEYGAKAFDIKSTVNWLEKACDSRCL